MKDNTMNTEERKTMKSTCKNKSSKVKKKMPRNTGDKKSLTKVKQINKKKIKGSEDHMGYIPYETASVSQVSNEKDISMKMVQKHTAMKSGVSCALKKKIHTKGDTATTHVRPVKKHIQQKHFRAGASQVVDPQLAVSHLLTGKTSSGSSVNADRRVVSGREMTTTCVDGDRNVQSSCTLKERCGFCGNTACCVGSQVAQLVEDVQKLQASLSKLRESAAAQVSKLEEELSMKNKALAILEDKLSSQVDYEEIKRELGVLKSMEFAGNLEGEEERGKGRSLEVLLLEKNKALQNENTQLKVSCASLSEQVKKLSAEATAASTTVTEQKSLIAQLEDDLRNVNALSSMFRGDAEGEPGPPNPATEVVADIVRDVMPSGVGGDSSSGKSAADSLLPIVQSQRERYRLRAQELEAQTLSQQQQLMLFQNEVDKLRLDNVKLYEKIRFLQSYPTREETEEQGGADDSTVNRYSSQYEERLNPFSSFNKQERQKRYAGLKPYEKIILGMGRVIMSNSIARTFFFFYTLLLHCLIFLVLYKLAHTESCKRDLAAECHQRFAEHMFKVHGESNVGEVGPEEGHFHGNEDHPQGQG